MAVKKTGRRKSPAKPPKTSAAKPPANPAAATARNPLTVEESMAKILVALNGATPAGQNVTAADAPQLVVELLRSSQAMARELGHLRGLLDLYMPKGPRS